MCRIFTRSTDIFSGTRGEKPLVCIGINPSTAEPSLEPYASVGGARGEKQRLRQLPHVQRLCPAATRPNDMERVCNEALHRANMEAFDYILSLSEQPAVWAAWGNIIEQRAYLKDCLADMIAIGERHGARWYTAGRRSVKGHPHHRLPQGDQPLDAFDHLRLLCRMPVGETGKKCPSSRRTDIFLCTARRSLSPCDELYHQHDRAEEHARDRPDEPAVFRLPVAHGAEGVEEVTAVTSSQ